MNVQADDIASIIALCITVIVVVAILRLTSRPWRQKIDLTLRDQRKKETDEDTAEWPRRDDDAR